MDTNTAAAATGTYTTNGRPHSFTSITPFLVVPNAAAALEFYREVFGAMVGAVTEAPDADGARIVAHAEVDFGTGRIQIGDPNPAYGLIAPVGDGHQTSYSMGIYVADVDATTERAVAHGAEVREPATTFVSGDRFASIIDPFGLRWSIMTRVEDLSDDESDARVAKWAAEQLG